MAQILRELVAGVPTEQLRRRAAQVLERINTGRDREPGEDDDYRCPQAFAVRDLRCDG